MSILCSSAPSLVVGERVNRRRAAKGGAARRSFRLPVRSDGGGRGGDGQRLAAFSAPGGRGGHGVGCRGDAGDGGGRLCAGGDLIGAAGVWIADGRNGGVAGGNGGNGRGGAPEPRRAGMRNRSRSGGQRREAAAGAVDGGDESKAAPGATLVTPKVSGAKLQTRIMSALILAVFGIYVTLSGGLVWALWMCAASYLAAKEYFTMTATMTSELPHPPPKWAGDVSIFLCAIFTLIVHLAGGKLTYVVMSTLGAFSIVAFLLITKQEEPHFSQFCATLFGIFYCGFLPAFWVKLRALAFVDASAVAVGSSGSRFIANWPAVLGGPDVWTTGLIVTIIAVFCIVASDVGAYVFGKTFGKHQLIAVSPNKTVEGAAGGLLCTVGTAFALRYVLGWHAGVVQTLCLGVVIFWAAVAGDLMESVMKRNAGMKDSGDIIPGHGGFLDRFDSYMFTGVAVYFYIVTVMPQWFQGIIL